MMHLISIYKFLFNIYFAILVVNYAIAAFCQYLYVYIAIIGIKQKRNLRMLIFYAHKVEKVRGHIAFRLSISKEKIHL